MGVRLVKNPVRFLYGFVPSLRYPLIVPLPAMFSRNWVTRFDETFFKAVFLRKIKRIESLDERTVIVESEIDLLFQYRN